MSEARPPQPGPTNRNRRNRTTDPSAARPGRAASPAGGAVVNWRQVAEELAELVAEDEAAVMAKAGEPLAVRLGVVLAGAIADGWLSVEEAAGVAEDSACGRAEEQRRLHAAAAALEAREREQIEAEQRRRREAARDEAERWARIVTESHERLTCEVRRGHLDRAETIPYLIERHEMAAAVGLVLTGCVFCPPAARRAA